MWFNYHTSLSWCINLRSRYSSVFCFNFQDALPSPYTIPSPAAFPTLTGQGFNDLRRSTSEFKFEDDDNGDEPRRRAPRALTGRHVKPGTGASPRTLQILRKKLLERLRLKELLGENSHLYFGALNKQKGGKKASLPLPLI